MTDQRIDPTEADARYLPHDVVWTPTKIARFWDAKSTAADGEYFSAMVGPALVDLIDRLIRPSPGQRILDLGCGGGHLLALLAGRDLSLYGADNSEESIATARKSLPTLPLERLVVGSLAEIPFAERTFDAVLLIETIEHIDDDDLRAMLAEVRRVLRPGGALFVTTPNEEQLAASTIQCPDCGARFHAMQHVRRWTAGSLAAALRGGGFTSVRTMRTRLPQGRWRATRALRSFVYALRRQRIHLIAVAR